MAQESIRLSEFGGYRKSASYNPLLIITQILALQTIYYISLGFLIWMLSVVLKEEFEFTDIFCPAECLSTRLSSRSLFHIGCIVIAIIIPIVGRSSQCLDFACTMHGIHIVFCSLIEGYRTILRLSVLLLLSLNCAITVQVGRWWCQRAELLPIPLGLYQPTTPAISRNVISTRIKFCLPVFTGVLARLVNRFQDHDTGEDAISLSRMASMPMIPNEP